MINESLSLKELFTNALEIATPEERNDYLQQASGGDRAVIEQVNSLLDAHGASEDFLDPIVRKEDLTARMPEASTLIGTRIGPYKIREQLGSGGMGVVYAADHVDGTDSTVALKLIKPGMDSKEVLTRFDAERESLGLMDHPHIAKNLGGGTTETGRPYFVMELVRGIPITDFCDRYSLTIRERLALFVQVCEAVQHAHLKGIIHRDIKPGNTLVELHDVKAVPKVIDFGIAKALGRSLTDNTIYTRFDALIGTPQYTSPEQAQRSGLDVDTRSDVYSLGVLLYELLVGLLPYEDDKISKLEIEQWLRVIREIEPPRPSQKFSARDPEKSLKSAQQRQTTPESLVRLLRRELDWIVMRALEKDRTRRYQSAQEFADDLRNYLTGKPVLACPPSLGYRAKKYVRRHWKLLVATVLILLTATIGTATSLWYASAANDNATQANANARLAHSNELLANTNAARARQAQLVAEQTSSHNRALLYTADLKLAAQFLKEGDIRNFSELLDQQIPRDETEPDLRGFEWWYLRQLAEADERILDERDEQGCLVRHSPDGKYLVLGWTDGQIDLRDAVSHELAMTFTGHGDFVNGCDFHPTEPILATIADDGTIRLWDLETQVEIRRINVTEGHAHRVFFNADGTQLVSSADEGSVRFWETSTGKPIGEISGFGTGLHEGVKRKMARSPDRRLLVIADSTYPESNNGVFDFKTHQKICTLQGLTRDSLLCVRFSPDSRHVVGGTRNLNVGIWLAETGELRGAYDGHRDEIQDVAFHPDGLLVVSSDRVGVVRTWHFDLDEMEFGSSARRTGWPVAFRAHEDRIWSLDFSPDGNRLITGSRDLKFKVWGRNAHPQGTTVTDSARNLQFLGDHSEILVSTWNQIEHYLHDSDDPRIVGSFPSIAPCLTYAPGNGLIATGHSGGAVHLWDLNSPDRIQQIAGDGDDVDHVALNRAGNRLLIERGKTVCVELWDTADLLRPRLLETFDNYICGWWIPGTDRFLLQNRDTLFEFDTNARQTELTFQGHTNRICDLKFSTDGQRMVTASNDRTIRVWERHTGKLLYTIPAHDHRIWSVAITPDGRTIISGDMEGFLTFSHVGTGRILFETKLEDQEIQDLEFSRDGRTLGIVQGDRLSLIKLPEMPPK